MPDFVRLTRRGAVAEITLDRPPANAIDVSVSQALYDAFREVEEDPELRVAIVTAAGERFFSAGWDLKAASQGEESITAGGPGGFAGLTEYFGRSKPVIAAVNGLAVGGGFELVLACDLAVAVEGVDFFLPEVRIGIVADSGGVLRLPKRLPAAVANRLILTGDRLSAEEAARFGLINEVVPREGLMGAAHALAERIIEAAPLALRAVKAVLEATETLSVEEGFARLRSGEIPEYDQMLSSEDALEGPRAFAEKRAPRWQGK